MLDEFFVEHIGDISIENCQILLVDGKILEVGEIHHILQSSYETKQSYVLITTGLSDDVSNTLFVNWQQGKTNIIPFIVRDEIDSINEMKDISVSCGSQICSNDTGTRISSIDLSDIPMCKVDYGVKERYLRIIPTDDAFLRISRLRKEIKEKIKDDTPQDVKELLHSRLSKLCLRNVILEIPGDSTAKGILEDKLNSFFSHISRCGSQGIVEVRKLYYSDYHTSFLPALDALIAIKRAASDRSAIDNIKAVIRLEKD